MAARAGAVAGEPSALRRRRGSGFRMSLQAHPQQSRLCSVQAPRRVNQTVGAIECRERMGYRRQRCLFRMPTFVAIQVLPPGSDNNCLRHNWFFHVSHWRAVVLNAGCFMVVVECGQR